MNSFIEICNPPSNKRFPPLNNTLQIISISFICLFYHLFRSHFFHKLVLMRLFPSTISQLVRLFRKLLLHSFKFSLIISDPRLYSVEFSICSPAIKRISADQITHSIVMISAPFTALNLHKKCNVLAVKMFLRLPSLLVCCCYYKIIYG